MYVPIGPVQEHLRALNAAGVGAGRAAELSGVPRVTVQKLSKSGRRKCEEKTALAVLAVPVPDSPHGEELASGAQIPALGTVRRLRALSANGYTLADIGARLGWKVQFVSFLHLGHSQMVTAKTARTVDDLFRELQMIPGTSAPTRSRARRRGWAPPLAWDEDTIDDPDAEPAPTGEAEADFADLVADRRAVGRTDDEIAAEMGVSMDTFKTRLLRKGIPRGRRYRDIEEHMEMAYGNTMSKRNLKAS